MGENKPPRTTIDNKPGEGQAPKKAPAQFKVGDCVQKGNGIKYRVCGFLECREVDRQDGKAPAIGYRWILSPGMGVPTFGDVKNMDYATADELKLIATPT